MLSLLALAFLIALMTSRVPSPREPHVVKSPMAENFEPIVASPTPQELPLRVENAKPKARSERAELKLKIINNGLTVKATLTNLSERPLLYCDVLHKYHTKLGYPWMSLLLRDKGGHEILTEPGKGEFWSPYLYTDEVFSYLRSVKELDLLNPRESAVVTTSLRNLLRGLPDETRQRIGTVQVHFSVPLDKHGARRVEAESEWVTLREELKSVDLLEGRQPLGKIYAE